MSAKESKHEHTDLSPIAFFQGTRKDEEWLVMTCSECSDYTVLSGFTLYDKDDPE